MPPSSPRFRTLHALRIKGFAKSEIVAEVSGLGQDVVESQLVELRDRELAAFREARALWQLTPLGRDRHREELSADVSDRARAAIESVYPDFLLLNGEFKALCGEWQLVDGDPSRVNDHSDRAYDAKIIERLFSLDGRGRPVFTAIGRAHSRMSPYASRLGGSLDRLKAGETKMFTGVMCSSYHDVWMELHEDLILSLGIDRAMEGSF